MQIFVPRYVPSLRTYHLAAMASPPCDPAFFLPIVFARAQNPHTPGDAAVERCKEAYDTFSPSHTDAALPLGSGVYSTDLLKRQAHISKAQACGRRNTLAANNPVAGTIFQKQHGHITA